MAKRITKPKAVKEPKPIKEKAPVKKAFEFEVLGNFWNTKEFKKYSNFELNKSMFMINRRLAIGYPKEAALVSKVGINGGEIIKWWQSYMNMRHPEGVSWLYTSSAKKTTTAKEYKPHNETVAIYCKWYDCTKKEVMEALKFYPEEIESELKEIETMYKKDDI